MSAAETPKNIVTSFKMSCCQFLALSEMAFNNWADNFVEMCNLVAVALRRQ